MEIYGLSTGELAASGRNGGFSSKPAGFSRVSLYGFLSFCFFFFNPPDLVFLVIFDDFCI